MMESKNFRDNNKLILLISQDMTSKPVLFTGSSPEEHVQSCCDYFDTLFSSPETLSVKISTFIESILIDSVSVGVSRKVFSHVISRVKSLQTDLCLEYCGILTEALKLRLMSFEDQITELNQHMAHLYEAKKDFGKAASNLSAIPLENSQKNYSKAFTTQMYLKIAHLYLEGRDSNQAEIFINRASLLITSTTEPDLQACSELCYQVHVEEGFVKFFGFLDADVNLNCFSNQWLLSPPPEEKEETNFVSK